MYFIPVPVIDRFFDDPATFSFDGWAGERFEALGLYLAEWKADVTEVLDDPDDTPAVLAATEAKLNVALDVHDKAGRRLFAGYLAWRGTSEGRKFKPRSALESIKS